MNVSKINGISSIENQLELSKYYNQIRITNRFSKLKQEALHDVQQTSDRQKELAKIKVLQAAKTNEELKNPQHLIDLLV